MGYESTKKKNPGKRKLNTYTHQKNGGFFFFSLKRRERRFFSWDPLICLRKKPSHKIRTFSSIILVLNQINSFPAPPKQPDHKPEGKEGKKKNEIKQK